VSNIDVVDHSLEGEMTMNELLDQIMDLRQDEVPTLIMLEVIVTVPPRRKIPG
jgi:hypothetical protein